MSLNITDIKFVGTWKYTCTNTECICKQSIYLPTINQINNRNIFSDNITINNCGHGFHKDCFNSMNNCPYDNTELVRENKDTVYVIS
jgi:hypothetical protein